jgi:hypothetical protein
MTFDARIAHLSCHPETPCEHVRAIEARVNRMRDGALAIAFRVDGDIARLTLPPPRTPERVDRLWEHTCFEAFIGRAGESAYREFNLSPSSEWAAYAFRAYRDNLPFEHCTAPHIALRLTHDSFELDAVIPASALPEMKSGAEPRLALSAVIEDDDGARSYWALKHPPGKPDFHHPDQFALDLGV